MFVFGRSTCGVGVAVVVCPCTDEVLPVEEFPELFELSLMSYFF